MLRTFLLNSCNELIEASIHYVNNDLKSLTNQKIPIQYEIQNAIKFNARSVFHQDQYSLIFYSEFFDRIYNAFNTLLYRENITFYQIISFGNEAYEENKAQLYLDILFDLACRLIINHELGHIFNGHLKFKKHHGQSPIMYMNEDQNDLSPLVSQALELNADAFAATRSIGVMTYESNIAKYNEIIPNLIKNKSHAFLLTVVAAVIVFSIQGLGRKRDKLDLQQLKYLPLRTRQDYYLRCAINAHQTMNSNEPLAFDIHFLREVVPNIEQYLNLYNHHALGFDADEYSNANNLDELSTVYLEHCDTLDSFWAQNMRERLKPFSYFPPA
ncbi:hypothetical protein SAMN05428961_11711 [Paenibacillus sp. OK060]|uniref:hypothetical protein n=1 Tax=Paenibacillus sp. OK060 TaxID=1881034 RepID=UPI00088EFF3A|nr:hypothetical protein [Paenibacillus sp. OK060]SDM41828.1 hypothetical protein SAMN05428961_11711 [Paenibacillus sp. OK060]